MKSEMEEGGWSEKDGIGGGVLGERWGAVSKLTERKISLSLSAMDSQYSNHPNFVVVLVLSVS